MNIRKPERLRRLRGELNRIASDPGLRENFTSLPRAPIQIVACKLAKAVNHGGIVRLAESFRLEKVTFENEADQALDFAGLKGTGKWQDWEFGEPIDTARKLKKQGYRIYALTLNDRAVQVAKANWQFPCAIILGEERDGMPPELEELADEIVAIPLYGMVESLNVVHAAVIAVHCAMSAYQEQNPGFSPARQVSRKLLGKE